MCRKCWDTRTFRKPATYLHAAEMGLQESMRRFDVSRGKPVAKANAIEPPLVGHEEDEQTEKGTLH